MALHRTIDAGTEPLTTAEAKTHLRVIGSTDDALIDSLIISARQMAENELRRSLITQTWTKTLDEFPDAIQLPYPPILSVSSVKYYDLDGVQQTMDVADYSVDIRSEPGYIIPAYGTCWPDTLDTFNAVEVVYEAGYGDAEDVPQPIKAWMLLHVGNLYENREATVLGVGIARLPYISSLLDPYRVAYF